MELMEMMLHRRSVRQYNNEPVSDEELKQILTAALSSPSGHAYYPCELIVVNDKEILKKLEKTRVGGGKIIADSNVSIFVIGDSQKADTWIEDCSIMLSNMHLMADSLGLGSCWIQGRNRTTTEGQKTDDFVRSILHYPEQFELLGCLTIGHIDAHPDAHDESFIEKQISKIHTNRF